MPKADFNKNKKKESQCCCNECSDHSSHHTHEEHSHHHCTDETHHTHHSCCGEAHSSHSCGCGCDHDEDDSRIMAIRLAAGGILFILSIIFRKNLWLALLAYFILGYDIIINGIKNIFKKHIFSEHFLMTIASAGAFLLGEFTEGCAVMLFYQIGEFFCDSASERSERSIRELIDIKPEYANLYEDGSVKKISPEALVPGNIIVVSSGEKIPADGIIIEGKTQLDTASMTGEEEYRAVDIGDDVISGCINCGGLIKIKVTSDYENSGVSKVMRLLDEIEENKSDSERFLTVFAKYYTPAVVLLAVLIFLIPSLITGEFSVWGYRALVFLVVSCPCALVISVPLAFFIANGTASRYGILIKGSLASEKLSRIRKIAFDKTGTLTKGSFRLKSIRTKGIKAEIFEYLAYAEFYSTHPLAEAVISEYEKEFKKEIIPERISDYCEIPGNGISVSIDGKRVLVGNEKLMKNNGIEVDIPDTDSTFSYISIDGKYNGYIEFTDGIKPEARDAVEDLKSLKIESCMLSGDKASAVSAVAASVGINEAYSELLPQDKVSVLDRFMEKMPTAFVGDGINDAPVISKADVGISMGLDGTDAAIEASDIVILSDDISRIPMGVRISRKTMRIVWENIILSIGIKVLIMLLGALGSAGLWIAVFGDVGVCILAVLNSLRGFGKIKSE